MHVDLFSLPHNEMHLSFCLSACKNTVTANCLYSSCVFLHSCLFTSSACPVFLSLLLFYSWLSTPPATSHFFFSSPLHHSPLLYLTSPHLSSLPLPFPSYLSSGCVKFSWGSERLALKPGGRRTRFLSTPCLALCV